MSFFGRDRQTEQLRTAIAGALTGETSPNVIFVTGEAGIGKSTLLASLPTVLSRLASTPIVATVACSTPVAGQEVGQMEALAPWAELMSRLTDDAYATRHGTGKLLTELALAWVPCLPVVGDVLGSLVSTTQLLRGRTGEAKRVEAASQQQIFQQYVNFLERLSARVGIVLAIDDAHWSDASSVNLLFTAARKLQQCPVVFVVAYRPDDAAAAESGEGHALLHVRAELERYGLAEEIGVQRLGRDEIAALLAARYPRYEGHPEFELWLEEVSSGNALFLTQFLATLEEDGHVDPATGAVGERYALAAVPGTVAAVVRERIRRVEREVRELLGYASVEGDEFTLAVLAAITEAPQLKLLQRLRMVQETHRIIRSKGRRRVYASESTSYEFEHTLVHRTLYESLEEEERLMVHAIVLDVLRVELDAARVTGAGIETIAPRLAAHARAVGDGRLAAEVLLEGARKAWSRWSEREALEMIASALEAIDDGGSDALRGALLLLRGNIHRHRARHRQALEDYVVARDLLLRAGDCDAANQALAHTASVHLNMGEREPAARLAREAVAEAEGLALVDGWLVGRGVEAGLLHLAGAYADAVPLRRDALAFVVEHRPGTYDEAMQRANLAIALLNAEQTDEALEHFSWSLTWCREQGELAVEANILLNLGVLHSARGDNASAIEHYREAAEIAGRLGDEWTRGFALGNLAAEYRTVRALDEAATTYDQALHLALESEDRYLEARIHTGLAALALLRGELGSARDSATRALALAREIGDEHGAVLACWRLAEAEWRDGDHSAARALLDQATAHAAPMGETPAAAYVEGERILVDLSEARARVEVDPSVLEEIRGRLERFVATMREREMADLDRWERALDELGSSETTTAPPIASGGAVGP